MGFSQWAIVFSFPKFTRREAGVVVVFFFFINTLCAGTQLTGRHAHAHTAAVAPALAFNCVMMCVR